MPGTATAPAGIGEGRRSREQLRAAAQFEIGRVVVVMTRFS
jgi:hypothetical protein